MCLGFIVTDLFNRKSWADAYGISENKLKIISERKKIGVENTVFKTKGFKDASRLQQTFAEMRDVFVTNGLDYGMHYFVCLRVIIIYYSMPVFDWFLVQEHIQGALIPESDAHLIATVWLSEYFECFDKSPEDEDLVHY